MNHIEQSGLMYTNQQYLINNSFHPGIQPKRVSFDTMLLSQVHKKIMRRSIIERRFKESFTSFKYSQDTIRKGFKGRTVPNLYVSPNKVRQRSVKTEAQERNREYRIPSQSAVNRQIQQKKMWVGHQTFNSRPNMMCNLTLYRKSFKKRQMPPSKTKDYEQESIQKLRYEWNRMKTVT